MTVAGLGGEPEYEQRFTGWAKDIDKLLKSAEPNEKVATLVGPDATKANVEAKLARFRQGSEARRRHRGDDDRPRQFRRGRLQVQPAGSGYVGDRTGRLAGQDSGEASTGGEHDQRQRRIAGVSGTAEPGGHHGHQVRHGKERDVFRPLLDRSAARPGGRYGQERSHHALWRPTSTPSRKRRNFSSRRTASPPNTPSSKTPARAKAPRLRRPKMARGWWRSLSR